MNTPESVVRVADPRALHALAHPTRVALLDHLMTVGPRTASQCAGAVGESASCCSWHMRQLARFGFVERVESADGRERPWRATATGFAYDPTDLGAGDESLQSGVLVTQIHAEEQALLRHLEGRNELSEPWRDASVVHTYHLLMTTEELAALQSELDEAIRRYIGLTRDDAPEEARPVRLHLRAYEESAL
jgi:hypothetical protein